MKALWFLGAVLMGMPVAAKADYKMNLAAPPYEVDKTILALDGWEPRLPTPTPALDSARVVAVRWNDYKPAVVLRKANLKNFFPATTGEKVNISFQAAFTFPEGAARREFRMFFSGAPIGEIYFDHAAGIGYNGQGTAQAGTVAVPKNEVKLNSFYNFNFALDFKTQTYDVTVTGLKSDGSPLNYSQQGVEFQVKEKLRNKVDGLYILGGPKLTVYLSELKVESK